MVRPVAIAAFFTRPRSPDLLLDAALAIALFLIPNGCIGLRLAPWYTVDALPAIQPLHLALWCSLNGVLLLLFVLVRSTVFAPVYGIVRQLAAIQETIHESQLPTLHTAEHLNLRALAHDLSHMVQLAQEHYRNHQEAQYALVDARRALSEICAQQQLVINTANREMLAHYQSVLAYSHYLEEQIERHSLDPTLRYDFDDVSESNFNLKLIAGALQLLQHPPHESTRIELAALLQQTLLALAPSLDRRAMQLTTIEVDLGVLSRSDPASIAHVLWMMLLGTIRYAADESTLRMRCFYSRDRQRCLISIIINELSPGRLTESEREAFLVHQLQHLSPHMFAETIRVQGNIQLAEMLLKRLDGSITILPLTTHSCEICLSLPAY